MLASVFLCSEYMYWSPESGCEYNEYTFVLSMSMSLWFVVCGLYHILSSLWPMSMNACVHSDCEYENICSLSLVF